MSTPGDGGKGSLSPRQSEPNTDVAEATTEMSQGQWGPVLTFPNVPIHVHVLPDGRVLMWGRRPAGSSDLNDQHCIPFVWDPADPIEDGDATTAKTVNTCQPTKKDGTIVNLFCSGHTFLPDGRLLVAGGHIRDGFGQNQTSIYNYAGGAPGGPGTWEPSDIMNDGRWYPTVTTLPDGRALVLSGSFGDDKAVDANTENNNIPQVWSDGAWTDLAAFSDPEDPDQENVFALELYPRVHINSSDGQVFMSGPQKYSWLLNTTGGGRWSLTTVAREAGQRDYAPAVMYDVDKIIYIGGGGGPPTSAAEIIDLQQTPLAWRPTASMNYPRRQHNATLLPDGTVLVTGGTLGPGFDDCRPGRPVHAAELWDPAQKPHPQWTELAEESVDRCYHSTAVLLPDATVLSAGGGEFIPAPGQPKDSSHPDGQIFRPPYLFKGDRPEITSAPSRPVGYGETFEVESPQADTIDKVTWVRLSSVTHAFNQSQRINFLVFRVTANTLLVTAPNSPNICPPGHYLLFVLNRNGVPSVARVVQILASPQLPGSVASPQAATATASQAPARTGPMPGRAAVAEKPRGPAVVVGLTSNCPYGLGACWGGANEALNKLDGVGWVNPIADAAESTAEVVLSQPGLPPLNRWVDQFRDIVSERYVWRGVEMTLNGVAEKRDGSLVLALSKRGPVIPLAPLTAAGKIQFDNDTRTLKPLSASEARAYEQLDGVVKGKRDGQQVTVTGRLDETPSGYVLHVRQFAN